MDKLVGDVAAVVAHFKQEKAVIVGHDWGGAVAWAFAMTQPKKTEALVVLNCPHPAGLQRELANNPAQQKASAYARAFQAKDAHRLLTPAMLASVVVTDVEVRKKYVAAFERSSLEGMLNYYKANYPRPPYKEAKTFPRVSCPVLMIHGLKDKYLLPGALNDTWKWLDGELTLVTIPNAGHWVHHDATETVNRCLTSWLNRRTAGKDR